MMTDSEAKMSCPLPGQYEDIVMAHGGGGRLMQQLIEKLIMPIFDNPWLNQRQDSAVMDIGPSRLAFTTDSYVVKPLFFPGGDIGKLAVCGTLNDLAVSGARPLFLSCSLIMEEGFAITSLQKVLSSMQQAANAAGVAIVTGDCKVVDKGKGDGLYINTSGIGLMEHSQTIAPASIRTGDAVIINGDLGRHSIAIMAEREGLAFESSIESDCADLSGLILLLIDAGLEIHEMRDLTRGGLTSALVEIARAAELSIEIEESALTIADEVQGACEILGFDPLYLANEGRFVLVLPASQAERALQLMHEHELGREASIIGRVGTADPVPLIMKSRLGTSRVLDLLSGEQLPRIC
jgi:hydrogenase expression/formation protein HypE